MFLGEALRVLADGKIVRRVREAHPCAVKTRPPSEGVIGSGSAGAGAHGEFVMCRAVVADPGSRVLRSSVTGRMYSAPEAFIGSSMLDSKGLFCQEPWSDGDSVDDAETLARYYDG